MSRGRRDWETVRDTASRPAAERFCRGGAVRGKSLFRGGLLEKSLCRMGLFGKIAIPGETPGVGWWRGAAFPVLGWREHLGKPVQLEGGEDP